MENYQGKLGFRIFPRPEKNNQELVTALGYHASANAADAQGRFRVMDPGIKGIYPGIKLSGEAVTVMCRPGDNLMVHKAIEMACPDDVIVVSTCGNTNSAVLGELMATSAMKAGIAGVIVDGAVRDAEAMEQMGFKVFARAVAASGCDKDGPGEINCPVSCGGVVVNPGDVIIGDADGVVVIRREDAAEVLRLTEEIVAREERRKQEIISGVLFKPEINNILRAKGIIS